MHKEKKPIKKVTKKRIFLGVCISIVLLPIPLFISYMVIYQTVVGTYNYVLIKTEERELLRNEFIQQHSEVLDSDFKFGVLGGSSNYCALAIGILYTSNLSPKEQLAIIRQDSNNKISYPSIFTLAQVQAMKTVDDLENVLFDPVYSYGEFELINDMLRKNKKTILHITRDTSIANIFLLLAHSVGGGFLEDDWACH